MKSLLMALIIFLSFNIFHVYAISIDTLKDILPGEQAKALSANNESTTISGLKEALLIGTENAVKSVSKVDGYFSNELIKIPLPEQIQKLADTATRIGLQQQVDNLILSMNRAAETAAPRATGLFVEAIKEMSIEDAKGILQGGDTSATDFFRQKTYKKLYDEFKPDISASMNRVGVAKAYKEMMLPLEKIPFLQKQVIDLDHYITGKALDGLFVMVGEEEKKIRSDPSARVTDLLKTVFGK